MNMVSKINKGVIERFSRLLGLACLSVVVINQTSHNGFSQETAFWISILGIICLSVTYNLKMSSRSEEELNFFLSAIAR